MNQTDLTKALLGQVITKVTCEASTVDDEFNTVTLHLSLGRQIIFLATYDRTIVCEENK